LLLEIHDRALERYGQSFPETIKSMDSLIELYGRWGKPAQADFWRERRARFSE